MPVKVVLLVLPTGVGASEGLRAGMEAVGGGNLSKDTGSASPT